MIEANIVKDASGPRESNSQIVGVKPQVAGRWGTGWSASGFSVFALNDVFAYNRQIT